MYNHNKKDWGKEFPELLKIWDYSKNYKEPENHRVTEKVWWKCGRGHTYCESIASAYKFKLKGCKICNGLRRVAWEKNNLAHNYPELMKQWDYEKNKDVNPYEVLPGIYKKVWWKCEKGHSYQQLLHLKALRNANCPMCSGHCVSPENNLGLHPISKEFHPIKNYPRTPQDFTYGSHHKVWWLCPNGHEHYSAIHSRTSPSGSGCPHCYQRVSKMEIWVFVELKKLFKNVVSGEKGIGCEIDVFLPDFKIAVEIDGYWWHKDNLERDKNKNEFLKNQGITLIRVREKPLPLLSDYDISHVQNYNKMRPLDTIKKLVIKISEITKVNVNEYLLLDDLSNEQEYLEMLKKDKNNNLIKQEIDLKKWWHPTKNEPLILDQVKLTRNKKFWWLCPNGHEFFSNIVNRVKGCGCPLCNPRNRKIYLKINPLPSV